MRPSVDDAGLDIDVSITEADSHFYMDRIDVLGCFRSTPGSTNGTQNNAAPTMIITL